MKSTGFKITKSKWGEWVTQWVKKSYILCENIVKKQTVKNNLELKFKAI